MDKIIKLDSINATKTISPLRVKHIRDYAVKLASGSLVDLTDNAAILKWIDSETETILERCTDITPEEFGNLTFDDVGKLWKALIEVNDFLYRKVREAMASAAAIKAADVKASGNPSAVPSPAS